jgi:hypothetical protein
MIKRLVACFTLVGILACYAVTALPPSSGSNERCDAQPILVLFDNDQDGELSENEIKESTHVLLQHDSNKDRILSKQELSSIRSGRAHSTSDAVPDSAVTTGAVVFEGGFETDPRDGGRPVALIAAALGVTSDLFRDVFRGVTPARGGGPTASQARANKRVLLDGLGKHGVTNERLDEVSDYYRYQPQSGNRWKHRPATAVAVIADNKVTAIKILDAGAGYLTPPRVKVSGFPMAKFDTQINFSTDLQRNGSIHSVIVLP